MHLVESKHTDTSTNIYEFHRNTDGTTKTRIIKTFKSYFFVDEQTPIEGFEGVISTVKGFKSIEKTVVKKVIVQKSNMVKPLRIKVEEMGYKHWEADILFTNRYTIDLKENIEETPLKVCWIDIETARVDTFKKGVDLTIWGKFPDVEEVEQVICCFTIKIGDKKTTWLCGPKDYPGTRYFKYEKKMLEDFIKFFHKESPDIISAWNLDGFDLPYMINRCKRLGVDYKGLSKTKDMWENTYKGKKEYRTFGTIQLDLLDGYRLWRKYGNLPLLANYSLDFVARTVLDDHKLDHGKTISWLWKNDLKTLIEYNIQDVELLDKIDKRCKIVGFFDNIRRKCRIQFQDVYKTTIMLDGYFISRLKGSIILPTAKHNKEDKFKGAFVFDPVPGVYDNILCEDIIAMYPSIIKLFNISYETVGGGDIILPLENKISFSKEPGIIPRFLDELKEERNEYKKLRNAATSTADYELYHQRQFATKIIMNAMFGYLGFPGSRLYKRIVAEAITGMGQYIIKEIARWCEERGNKVIYGDTDSVYITSLKTEKWKVVLDGVQVATYINKKLAEFALKFGDETHLFIEFEKGFKRILFTDAKKRYAYTLLWDADKKFNVDKKIHIQGFDAKRSDSNLPSKQAQLEVIEMVIHKKSKSDVLKYLRSMERDMKNGKFTDEEIGFPKGITKDLKDYNPPTPIIKGAAFSNKYFDTSFGKGTKPKFVYITTYNGQEKYIFLNKKTYLLESITFDKKIPKGFQINWDRMSDNTFRKKLQKIFDSAGWEWEQLSMVGLSSWGAQ